MDRTDENTEKVCRFFKEDGLSATA